MCRKKNQPPNQNPQLGSLETWSHQEFLFVLGKSDMTSGSSRLPSQVKRVFFSQPRMGIMRTMTMASYIISEKRALLWLILLETAMRTLEFILLLSHSLPISPLFSVCTFCFLLWPLSVFSPLLFSLRTLQSCPRPSED